MSKITADEVNQNSIPLSLSATRSPRRSFTRDLVLMEAASPNEGRNQGKNRREGKALKIVYFYDLLPIKQSNLREPLSSVPHHSSPVGYLVLLCHLGRFEAGESLSAAAKQMHVLVQIKTFSWFKLLFIIFDLFATLKTTSTFFEALQQLLFLFEKVRRIQKIVIIHLQTKGTRKSFSPPNRHHPNLNESFYYALPIRKGASTRILL